MKLVKFRDYLVPLVLSGQKNSTWRLFDDKDLSIGDDVELCEFGKDDSFATARITKVIEKPFGELKDDDKEGHETFSTDYEMYKTYSGYYNTNVKIIWFKLTDRF